MTSNQIEYVKHREQQRHNLAMETETQRSDLAKEREQARANDLNYSASIYSSQASMYNAKLNYDANLYASQLNYASHMYATQEQTRLQGQRNMDMLMLESSAQKETYRHNKAMEEVSRQDSESKAVSSFGSVLNALGKVAQTAGIFLAA